MDATPMILPLLLITISSKYTVCTAVSAVRMKLICPIRRRLVRSVHSRVRSARCNNTPATVCKYTTLCRVFRFSVYENTTRRFFVPTKIRKFVFRDVAGMYIGEEKCPSYPDRGVVLVLFTRFYGFSRDSSKESDSFVPGRYNDGRDQRPVAYSDYSYS